MAGMARRLKRVYEDRRERWGLTQKRLSHGSGVSQSVISELMNEELPPRASVTAAVILNLCKALKADPSFVLIGKGDVIPEIAWAQAASLEPVDISEEDAPLEEESPREPPAPRRNPSPPATPERTARKPSGRTSQSPGS